MRPITTLLALALLHGCSDPPPPQVEIPNTPPADEEPDIGIQELVKWRAKVQSSLPEAIESELNILSRVKATRPNEPVQIVLLNLPPRNIEKTLPTGQTKIVANPVGAPSRIKLRILDVIKKRRLAIDNIVLLNGTKDPESPTPFQ